MSAEVVNTPDIAQQYFDLNGDPLSSGRLAFFENNSDVPASVYTAGGSVELGSEITLDSSGFPETQFALEAGKNYTIKAFDSDNVLIWTRNDVFGGGAGGGISGDYIPMEGTTQDDPVRGPLVWNDANGKNTIQSNQIRIDGSNNFNYLSHSQVWIYTPTAQSQLYSNELDIFSTQVGRAGTAKIRNDYLQYSQPGNTAVSYFTPNTVQLTNSNGASARIQTSTLGVYPSARIDLSANTGNSLSILCNDTDLGYNSVESNKILHVSSAEHLYMYGSHVDIQSTASTGSMDIILNSQHGQVRVMTDENFFNLLSGTKLAFGQGGDMWVNKIVNTLNVDPSDPDDHGLITEAAVASMISGSGMTNPMTDEGDMIVGGVDGAPTRLPFGTAGQLLTINQSGVPEWSEKPSACQENYSIIDSTGVYSASGYNDQILLSKVLANFDRVYTQIGFGLKKGQQGVSGKVGLAIYDVARNLIAKTQIVTLANTYLGQVYWIDAEDSFTLKAGDEYLFAFYTADYPASNLIQFLGHAQNSSFDSDLVGVVYGQQGLSEMPNSLPLSSVGSMVVHMAVR